jgi:hypothetical protein
MADFRTIALIMAMGMLADFLYSVFIGRGEIVDSTPPDIVNVNHQKFNAEQIENEYMDESLHGDTPDHYTDEDLLFDTSDDSDNHEHKQSNI